MSTEYSEKELHRMATREVRDYKRAKRLKRCWYEGYIVRVGDACPCLIVEGWNVDAGKPFNVIVAI